MPQQGQTSTLPVGAFTDALNQTEGQAAPAQSTETPGTPGSSQKLFADVSQQPWNVEIPAEDPSTDWFLNKRQAAPPESWASYLYRTLMPSTATISQTTGASIGGDIGTAGGYPGRVIGGFMGGAGGESFNQYLALLQAINPDWVKGFQALPGGIERGPTSIPEAGWRVFKAGLEGAGQEAVGGLLSTKPVTGTLERGAASQTKKVLGPLEQGTAEALSKEIPVAGSKEALAQQLDDRIAGAKNEVDAAYQNAMGSYLTKTGTSRLTPPGNLIQRIQNAQNGLKVGGRVLTKNQAEYDLYDEAINWLKQDKKGLTLNDLRNIAESGPEGARQVARDVIYGVAPDIAEKEATYDMWQAGRTAMKQGPPPPGFWEKLVDKVAPLAIGGVGYKVGLPGIETAMAMASPAMKSLMQSTAWRTASIAGRRAAIQALNSGSPLPRVIRGLTSMGIGMGIHKMYPLTVEAPNPLPPGGPP